MTYHCPASFGPNEEFLAPTGEWLSVFRAIAYDSWLLWRHALPDYRRLNDTPFTVSRWWDPLDDQEDWQLGGRCLLKINGYESRHIPIEAGGRFGLTITPISAHWLEFALREDPVAA